jgi:uncharacterized protein
MWKISLLLSAFALTGNVAAASFDCQKAKSELEHLLCNNAELSLLDSRLGETYKTLTKMLNPSEMKQLRATQTEWLERRVMDCAVSNVDCVKRLYQKRIDVLTFRASPEYKTSAAGKVAGAYEASKNMGLSVDALSPNTIKVSILGAGEAARWTCDFSAEGELKNGSAKLHDLDDAEVSFRFDKNKVVVSENTDQSVYCGAGGALQGTYTRVTK